MTTTPESCSTFDTSFAATGDVTVIPAGIGGLAGAAEIVRVPDNVELVTNGGTFAGIGDYNLQILSDRINSQSEKLDSWVVQAMLDDPTVYSCHEIHKAAVLSSDMTIHPAFEDVPEGQDPPPGDPAEARRAAAACREGLRLMTVPIEVWGKDALDARAYGHKVAEEILVYRADPDGRSGRYVSWELKMKPRWAYHLCTDPFYNLLALYCQTPVGPAYIDAGHFVVFSWDVKDSDPRGSSRFRAAKDPWRRKLRSKDGRSKGDDQFGTPNICIILPENAPVESQDPDNPTGKPIPTTQAVLKSAKKMVAGGVLVLGHGGSAGVVESQRDGKQLADSIDYDDREITRAMLLQDRATMNAEHYTQGGADAGQDVMSDDVAMTKRWFCSIVQKQMFWRLLAANRGPAYADLYTPRVTLGAIDLRKFAELMNPIAVIMQSAGLTRSQLNAFFAMFGMPTSLPGELRIGPGGAVPDTVPEPKPLPEPDKKGADQ